MADDTLAMMEAGMIWQHWFQDSHNQTQMQTKWVCYRSGYDPYYAGELMWADPELKLADPALRLLPLQRMLTVRLGKSRSAVE